MEVGKREIMYLSLHCHHQNDSCIKMGSDDSHHFNVSLNVRDTVTRQCPQITTFLKRKESRSGPVQSFFYILLNVHRSHYSQPSLS